MYLNKEHLVYSKKINSKKFIKKIKKEIIKLSINNYYEIITIKKLIIIILK